MKRLLFGLCLGLALGTVSSGIAQTTNQPKPCAAVWIVWIESIGSGIFSPHDSYQSYEECQERVGRILKTPNMQKFNSVCLPDTVDPRPR